mmetsp:Transcript_528/g.880  ORF Transcript_528/g.880 Transcript_528/m.880 type:complete len:116 (-) Transcript_528:212-559(-)
MTPYLTKDPLFRNAGLSDDRGNEEYIYDLTSVVNHHGKNLNQGHFTAYGYNEAEGVWFCFNDRKVTVVSADEVARSQAYLLIYERRWKKIEELGSTEGEDVLMQRLLSNDSSVVE